MPVSRRAGRAGRPCHRRRCDRALSSRALPGLARRLRRLRGRSRTRDGPVGGLRLRSARTRAVPLDPCPLLRWDDPDLGRQPGRARPRGLCRHRRERRAPGRGHLGLGVLIRRLLLRRRPSRAGSADIGRLGSLAGAELRLDDLDPGRVGACQPGRQAVVSRGHGEHEPGVEHLRARRCRSRRPGNR